MNKKGLLGIVIALVIAGAIGVSLSIPKAENPTPRIKHEPKAKLFVEVQEYVFRNGTFTAKGIAKNIGDGDAYDPKIDVRLKDPDDPEHKEYLDTGRAWPDSFRSKVMHPGESGPFTLTITPQGEHKSIRWNIEVPDLEYEIKGYKGDPVPHTK